MRYPRAADTWAADFLTAAALTGFESVILVGGMRTANGLAGQLHGMVDSLRWSEMPRLFGRLSKPQRRLRGGTERLKGGTDE